MKELFQSTLPMQGKTEKAIQECRTENDISIHSPYTGRDPAPGQAGGPDGISIHSPYTGRDLQTLPIKKRQKDFNPLSLYRERRG